jgi:MarR family transcriptional repressor of emrRAB
MTHETTTAAIEETLAASFTPADARLAITAERFSGFDRETVTLARLINFVAKGLSNHANQMLKTYDMNHTGYAVLVMLYGSPDYALTPSLLVEATHEKSTNITRICDDLLRKGLIERDVDLADRRKVQVRLSDSGMTLLTAILPDMVTLTQDSFARLSADERMQLNTLLRKVIAGQERMR